MEIMEVCVCAQCGTVCVCVRACATVGVPWVGVGGLVDAHASSKGGRAAPTTKISVGVVCWMGGHELSFEASAGVFRGTNIGRKLPSDYHTRYFLSTNHKRNMLYDLVL